MSNTNTGGPAFPRGEIQTAPGMTLRDYFAAKAMLAIVCDPHHDTGDMGGYDNIAKFSYEMADAMIKARSAK
jgi:hypothetical protein